MVVRTIAGGPAATSKLLHTDDRIMGIGEDEEIVDIGLVFGRCGGSDQGAKRHNCATKNIIR